MKMKMMQRQRGIKLQGKSIISQQIMELNKSGIYPIESRIQANMIVVRKEDLERASRLKIDDSITIASRY